MKSAIFDFKSIRQTLERQDQKAEFVEKNPKPPDWFTLMPSCYPMYGVYQEAESDGA